MSQEANPGRKIVNAHLNLTNMVSVDEYRDILIGTLDKIISSLMPHCGPRAQYAMVFQQCQQLEFDPNLFLKDGIKITGSLEFASPIQAYLKNMLTYIGRRVDSAARDGTTTSVLMASMFLKEGLLRHQDIRALNLTTVEMENTYSVFIQMLGDYLSKQSWNMESLQELFPNRSEYELAGVIAFLQTLSSSGGNAKLADCMQNVFANTHKAGWSLQHAVKSGMETTEAFSVQYPDYDFVIPAQCQSPDIYNYAMGTQYLTPRAKVFALPSALIDGDAAIIQLYEYIKNYPDKKQPLVIIATTMDPRFVSYVNQLNRERKVPIALFTRIDMNLGLVNTRNELHLEALNAIASRYPYVEGELSGPLKESRHIIKAKTIVFDGREIRFSGLAEYDKDFPVHYNYTHPNRCKFYTELLEHILTTLKHHRSRHRQVQLDLVERCEAICKLMVCPRAPSVFLGGATHELLSNEAVIQDVIGATMESIQAGFLINGLPSFMRIIEQIRHDTTEHTIAPEIEPNVFKRMFKSAPVPTVEPVSPGIITTYGPLVQSPFFQLLLDCIDRPLNKLIENLYQIPYTKIQDRCNGMTQTGCRDTAYLNILDLSSTYQLEEFVSSLFDGPSSADAVHDYPVTQPTTIYRELFKRVGELMLRLISTDKFIVPGGVVISHAEMKAKS